MSEGTSKALLRAFELIESDNQEEARNLLRPILAEDENNADAWWLYVHALEDPEEAEEAMSQLLSIDPNYPGAVELNKKLRSGLGDFDDSGFDDFEDVALASQTEAAGDAGARRTWSLRRLLIPVVALVVIILLIVVLLSLVGGDDDSPEVAANPTETAETTEIATEEAVTTPQETEEAGIEVTAESQGVEGPVRVLDAFSLFTLGAPEQEIIADPTLGNVLVVNVCSSSQEATRDTLDRAMLSFANVWQLVSEAEAVGVRIVDCSTNEVINVIGTELAWVSSFSSGQIDETEYRANWRVVEP